MERRGKKQQIIALRFMQQTSPGFTVENIQQTEKKGYNFSKVCELFILFLSVSIFYASLPQNDFEKMDLSILLKSYLIYYFLSYLSYLLITS